MVYYPLRYVWNPAKSDRNAEQRGFDFATATLIFGGPVLERDGPMTRRLPKKPSRGRADYARMDRMTEAEIMRTSPPELADLPDDFFKSAVMVFPQPKQPISLRVDEDILAWFKSQGPRYQSRMNAVLRAYMTAQRDAPAKKRNRKA